MAYQVPLVLLKLSDTLAICATRVTAMMSTDSKQARDMIKAEKENKTLINGCGRNKAVTMVILDNGAIATSTHTINHLCKLLETSNGKRIVKSTVTSKSNIKLVEPEPQEDVSNDDEVPDCFSTSDTNIESGCELNEENSGLTNNREQI